MGEVSFYSRPCSSCNPKNVKRLLKIKVNITEQFCCPRCHVIYNPSSEIIQKYTTTHYVVKPITKYTLIGLHKFWRQQKFSNKNISVSNLIEKQV